MKCFSFDHSIRIQIPHILLFIFLLVALIWHPSVSFFEKHLFQNIIYLLRMEEKKLTLFPENLFPHPTRKRIWESWKLSAFRIELFTAVSNRVNGENHINSLNEFQQPTEWVRDIVLLLFVSDNGFFFCFIWKLFQKATGFSIMHKCNDTFSSYSSLFFSFRLYFVLFQSFFILSVYLFNFVLCIHCTFVCFMLYDFGSLSFSFLFFFVSFGLSYLFLSATVCVGFFLFGSIRLLLSIFFTINFCFLTLHRPPTLSQLATIIILS